MQLHFIIVTLLLSLIVGPKLVSAKVMVRFVFNNGVESSACTSTELAIVAKLFANDRRSRRRLGRLSGSNETASRGLQTFTDKCKRNCLGIKCCYATGCLGYDGTIKNRNLGECEQATALINTNLNYHTPVSSACKSFLSIRQSECYDDTMYGEIKSATISKSNSPTVNLLPGGQYSTCTGTRVEITANTNECVDDIKFALSGPNGIFWTKSDNYAPFSYSVVPSFPGSYTLTITPDARTNAAKTFRISARTC